MEVIIQLLLIIGLVVFIAKKFMPVKGITNITTQEAKFKAKDKNIQFIDVRTPAEFKANYRKPFQNVPLAELNNRIAEFDKNKETIVMCQSGMRSMKASRILKKKGFAKVVNVKGGINLYK